MIVWKYKIIGNAGIITTKNTELAEQKSKSGYIVYCKRESNIYKYNH
jgi:hypothetical protein